MQTVEIPDKTADVSNIHLNLKKVWFDLILSGEKKEEYREIETPVLTLSEQIKELIRKNKISHRHRIYFFYGVHSAENEKNPYLSTEKKKNGSATWSRYYAKLWNIGRSVAIKNNYFQNRLWS